MIEVAFIKIDKEINMKKLLGLILFCVMVLCCSCKKYSVEDAINKDDTYSLVSNEKATKDISGATITDMQNHTEEEIDGNAESAKVTEVDKGQSCTYGGYQISVTGVWRSEKNLLSLDDIEGDTKFRDFIVKQYNLGGDPSFHEDGSYIKGGIQYVYVKLKIRNVSASSKNIKINIAPLLFNKDGEKKYTRITSCESIGFDQYKNLDSPEIPHKDANMYEFAEGEEIETVVVMRVGSAEGVLRNVYLFTGFLNSNNGLGDNKIPDGSYMLKLNLIDDQYNKVK